MTVLAKPPDLRTGRLARWTARARIDRPTWLTAAAALIGLALALPRLFAPAAPPPTTVPPGDIALVNLRPILQSDYIAQVEAQTSTTFDAATPAERARVLHDMIDEELAVQRALALDLPLNDEDVRQALVEGVAAAVNAPVLAQPVSDATLRAFYAAHRADYTTDGTMRIANIVLHVGGYQNADQSLDQATADATEAAYQLRAGAALDAVMDHFGLVPAPQSQSGEQFDFAAKLHLGEPLYAVATTMNVGDVSDPQIQPDGVHLLIMQSREPPQIAAFDRVRASVYTAWRHARQAQAVQANMAFLRRHATILLAPGAGQ